jgi:hypothetical protein
VLGLENGGDAGRLTQTKGLQIVDIGGQWLARE